MPSNLENFNERKAMADDYWNDVSDADVWHDVFEDEEEGWLVSANVGERGSPAPLLSVCRCLPSGHDRQLLPVLTEDSRVEAAIAYRELARCLHRLANKAMLEAEKLVPTLEFEIPIEVLSINLMNEKLAWGEKHGGGALTIAEGQLAAHLRARGWVPSVPHDTTPDGYCTTCCGPCKVERLG